MKTAYRFCFVLLVVAILIGCKAPGVELQPHQQLGGQPDQVLITEEPPATGQPTDVTLSQGATPTATASLTVEQQRGRVQPVAKTSIPTVSAGSIVSPNDGAPTAASSGEVSPRIVSFRASPAQVNPGDTVTLSWQATGVSAQLAMCKYDMSHPCMPDGYSSVPLEGTHAFIVPEHVRYRAEFVLVVKGSGESDMARESVSVPVICPTRWFFEGAPEGDYCPEEKAVTSHAAIQSFEHGSMMWIEAQDVIYAFLDSRQYASQQDIWEPSMPESDPALVPPPGLYQPVRGFGLAWRDWLAEGEHPLKDFLGWATTLETSTEVTYQCSEYKWHDRVCYFRDLNGRIVSTNFSANWAIVRP